MLQIQVGYEENKERKYCLGFFSLIQKCMKGSKPIIF